MVTSCRSKKSTSYYNIATSPNTSIVPRTAPREGRHLHYENTVWKTYKRVCINYCGKHDTNRKTKWRYAQYLQLAELLGCNAQTELTKEAAGVKVCKAQTISAIVVYDPANLESNDMSWA